MNAPANLPEHTAAARQRAQRHDGWTPDRQRFFLEAIAEGQTVDAAARLVGMSAASAYAFRRRAPATTFAVGWSGANLLARERLAAMLFARAVEGQVETLTRPDGSTIARHKYDNRLAATMLARLDRQAEAPECGAALEAARLVAQEFDAFLDVLERNEGPARTGLFLGTRAASDADLAPIVSLARADRYCRTGVALAGEVDTTDLDIVDRAQWTAERWQRAEAAGLLVLGRKPADETATGSQLPQLHDDAGEEEEDDWGPEPRVFWDGGEWRTNFPPPEDYWGFEDGVFGSPDYSRSLTEEELKAHRAMEEGAPEEEREADARQRDLYFGFIQEEPAPAGAGAEPAAPALALPPPGSAQDDDGLAEFEQFIAEMDRVLDSG
ncbi:hypothetical protein [Sphingomonas xinjiangensis]|uniref:Uncharacterized protein n=1 Tax=Sphingomonas xinjiangensis TaxID=643568 RepID=A0A840YDX7_9SPHN|nr:hypothetical protein [Sphingomonas xinjiangensis]MBB5710189.1 hypothetical protein [Sphingomonas xinjiangensis]